jgi:O-antigen/teichoic acid export membrane protein
MGPCHRKEEKKTRGQMDSTTAGAMEKRAVAPTSRALRRLLMGIGSSGMSQAIAAVQPILLVPLFLRAWGAKEYGRWLVLTALVSYLSMLDFGGQNYIGNLLTIDYAQGRKESFRERLSEGVSLFTFIALAAFIFLVILLLGLVNLNLPVVGNALPAKDRWIILFLGSAFLLSIPSGIYVTAYRASGLFVRGTMLGNVLRMGHLASSAVLLYIAVSPFVYALVFLIAAVIGTMVIVWDSRRKMVACRQIHVGLAEAKRGRRYLRGALQFWLLALATGLNQQGVLLVLAISTSPAIVALYATHRTAAGLVGYMGSLLQAPLWPELSFLWARECRAELGHVALLAIRVVVVVSGLGALTMWVLLPFIYPVWTGRQLQLQPSLFAVFLVQGVLAAGWLTCGWSLLAANQHRGLARWSLANAVVTIVLSVLLAPRYGVLGVAVATLSGDVFCGLAVYPKLAGRMLGLSAMCIYQTMAFMALLLAPLLAAVVIGGRCLHGWVFVAVFGVAVTIWCIPTLPLVLERKVWRRLGSLSQLLGRGP